MTGKFRMPRCAGRLAAGLLLATGAALLAVRSVPRHEPSEASRGTAGRLEAAGRGGVVEVFPGVRINRAAREVEFDGVVPIDAHDPKTPLVFLETFVCGQDSREHESLVVTSVKPAYVHAALLTLGAHAGKPGVWEWRGGVLYGLPPEGSPLTVRFRWRDGSGVVREAPAWEWVELYPHGGKLVGAGARSAPWRFAGSFIKAYRGREYYDADMTGQLVGLTTFGGETIAWHRTLSPEAAVHEPEWIADARIVPAYGTPVTVVVRIGG